METLQFILIGILLCLHVQPFHAAIFDWFWDSNNDATTVMATQVNVPFESKTDDEKFLEEALKFTDIMKSSALDVCQHNVVLKIKTSCSSMTEEELAKMSVNLLNCQSQVDGRTTFPCTETMTLKECTVAMDPAMWNAYHMMNNRARAVCLSSRRSQFQALSEMTVNKLLSTAQQQILQMADLQKGQEELEALTSDTMAVIREGNVNILVEQDKIQMAQQAVQNSVMKNLKELSREKSLIAAGNKELDVIKQKIDETNKEIVLQSLERSGHHHQVISDLETIQKQAAAIFEKIDQSTQRMLTNHALASKQYAETLQNLKKINDTIGYLAKLLETSHSELQLRVEWIKSFLGESGEELSKLTCAVLHIAYLLMGMLLSSFLHLPFVSRVALILIVPLNLTLIFENKDHLALDLFQITATLLLITAVNALVNLILGYVVPERPKYFLMGGDGKTNVGVPMDTKGITTRSFASRTRQILDDGVDWLKSFWSSARISARVPATPHPSGAVHDSLVSSTGREVQDNNETVSPRKRTPPRKDFSHHLVSNWLDDSHFRPRAGTPLSTASVRSGSPRNLCAAQCRTGRPCRNVSTPGREYCRVHEGGSSVVA